LVWPDLQDTVQWISGETKTTLSYYNNNNNNNSNNNRQRYCLSRHFFCGFLRTENTNKTVGIQKKQFFFVTCEPDPVMYFGAVSGSVSLLFVLTLSTMFPSKIHLPSVSGIWISITCPRWYGFRFWSISGNDPASPKNVAHF